MPDIDVAGAQAALDAAGGMPEVIPSQSPDPFNRNALGQFASAPEAAPAAPETTEPATEPAATQAPEAGTEEPTDLFASIPEEALTPEMQQLRRSLLADYTQKTQEIAPWRKLGKELGVDDPSQVREALEVYQRLQDPSQWPMIHGELTQYMQQYGMSVPEASQAAADALASFAPAEPTSEPDPFDGFDTDELDPTTAQLMSTVQGLQDQLRQMQQSQQQAALQAQQQAQVNAIATRIRAEEAELRAANPHYTDANIEAIYRFMPAGDPNASLVQAQQEYERLIGAEVARYIGAKGAAHATTPTPAPPAGQVQAGEQPQKLTPEQAHQAAMEWVRQADLADRA